MAEDWEVATWRYERIGPLLDPQTTDQQRIELIRKSSKTKVEWPARPGAKPKTAPIDRKTLDRWVKAYAAKGILGLHPKQRSDKGKPRSDRQKAVSYALALLYEAPERSLTLLITFLQLEFPEITLHRSTLHRDLSAHPAYRGIIARRKGRGPRLCDRYESAEPHEIWQLDGKGPFEVRFVDGSRCKSHVLSVLDDKSRAILAAIIARSEDTASAIRVVRLAAEKYGLARRFQFDRGSAFDSHVFRAGLATLGIHRNAVKAKNPKAQGKIEAYHRSLQLWFVNELRFQEVVDLGHLEVLLQAMIDELYNRHQHREIKSSPADALAGRVSSRRVSREDIRRAFRERTKAKSDPKTGQVTLPNGSFRVSERYAGVSAAFSFDLVEPEAFLVLGVEEIPLQAFEIKRPFFWEDSREKRGRGQLQKIVDRWNGRERPNADPGFGLPEIFRELGTLLGRLVPLNEREASAIERFYSENGPLPAEPFRNALSQSTQVLGLQRPLSTYLQHIGRLVKAAQKKEPRA